VTVFVGLSPKYGGYCFTTCCLYLSILNLFSSIIKTLVVCCQSVGFSLYRTDWQQSTTKEQFFLWTSKKSIIYRKIALSPNTHFCLLNKAKTLCFSGVQR
jgi:hypothetical protein